MENIMEFKYVCKIIFYLQITLFTSNLFSQPIYFSTIREAEECKNFEEPIATITYKANSNTQKVIAVGKNFSDNKEISFVVENCTVIDKDNWNCQNSYASNGNAHRKDDPQSGYKSCHYVKKLFGGWEQISFDKKSAIKPNKFDIGHRVGVYIKVNFVAEIFKESNCKEKIIKNNNSFFVKNHLADSSNYLREKFKLNSEIQKLLNPDTLAKNLLATSEQIQKELDSKIGDKNPSSLTCGKINGQIDAQITAAKKDIDSID